MPSAVGVGDLAVVTMEKTRRLRVVSKVSGQQNSLVDFGDQDSEIEFLKDHVIKLAK